MKHRVLSEHFGKVLNKLVSFAEHFDIANHGDIKGYGREVLVQEYLQAHLPSQLEFLTGEVIDENDRRSGQTDSIIQSSSQPKIPLLDNVHLSFSDAVIATIEVKSNLTTQHLHAALKGISKIKSLSRRVKLKIGPMAREITDIPCIIFAFKGPTKETLIESINNYAKNNDLSLNDCSPDMVVVLDRQFYICKNDGWQFPVIPIEGAYYRDWSGLPHECLVGPYNYLNNVIQSYLSADRPIDMGKYFDKSVGLGEIAT